MENKLIFAQNFNDKLRNMVIKLENHINTDESARYKRLVLTTISMTPSIIIDNSEYLWNYKDEIFSVVDGDGNFNWDIILEKDYSNNWKNCKEDNKKIAQNLYEMILNVMQIISDDDKINLYYDLCEILLIIANYRKYCT